MVCRRPPAAFPRPVAGLAAVLRLAGPAAVVPWSAGRRSSAVAARSVAATPRSAAAAAPAPRTAPETVIACRAEQRRRRQSEAPPASTGRAWDAALAPWVSTSPPPSVDATRFASGAFARACPLPRLGSLVQNGYHSSRKGYTRFRHDRSPGSPRSWRPLSSYAAGSATYRPCALRPARAAGRAPGHPDARGRGSRAAERAGRGRRRVREQPRA